MYENQLAQWDYLYLYENLLNAHIAKLPQGAERDWVVRMFYEIDMTTAQKLGYMATVNWLKEHGCMS
jgi:hypothetical protein